MKKLLSIILSITMLLSMATVAFADGIDGPMQKAVLTVGVNAEFAPFEYYDEDGELTGFDIDLMNYIGERIGFDIEFVNISFDKLIPAVVNGEVDCAISAITITEEREKVIDFSTPYISLGVLGESENYAIVFPEGSKVVKNITVPEGKQEIYLAVNQAIKELIDDATVEKLLEVHEVEKHFIVDDEDVEVNYIDETKDDAAFVMDILKLAHENIASIHIGRVNENQHTEIIKIENPDDVKAFYNKFIALPFVEKADNYDGITIQFKNNGVLTSYYTTYGVFGGTFGTHYDEGRVRDMYVSEQEIYKIIEELNYKWEVYYADAYTDTSVAETVPAPSEWAAKDIDFAYAMGITDSNKQYIYQNSITREDFCELIYKLIRIVGVDIEDASEDFTDTDNKSIAALFTMGIINGKTATEFAPNDSLTREEAAAIIIRMINKVMPMAATELWFEYDDIDEISKWASDSVQTISNLGFMNGVGNNRFAPKDTYTTEQAIATLVRVYRAAEAAGVIERISDIGIIGGADGPTSIIVGDNVNVIEKEEFEKFYVEVQTKTTEVDDFYIDEAIKLVTESGELAADKAFINYYTSSDDMTNKVLELGVADYSKPSNIYYMAANREQIISKIYNISDLSGEELDGFDIEKLLKLNKVDFSIIGNMINASYGAENLAALTILTNSRGYVMPKDFTDDFALYLEYDGEYSALVSFSKFGDGVIKATMSFVNNGERDNIFRRIYEITQGLGEDSIDVAIVK